MWIIFNRTPCTDRHESIINETRGKWAGFSGLPITLSMGAPLQDTSAPRAPQAVNERWSAPNAVSSHLSGRSGPPRGRITCSPPVSCVLFFITQEMTYLSVASPSCRFPLPAFSENKAGNPFYLHSASIPILCFFFFSFIFISWRLITLQYCSGFCHILTWISHGVTCIPHYNPSSHLPLHPIPLGLPSAPGPSTCLMHPTWAGDLFHYR